MRCDPPPPPEEYRKLTTRVVDLHPMTIIQNARTSGGGVVQNVPTQAISVGPGRDLEGGKGVDLARRAARQPVRHAPDDADDLQRIADSAVPMSLLADHPNVQFNFYRPGIGVTAVEMHYDE